MSRLQSVRGMHDVLPDEAQIRRRIEQVWIDAACGFGYEEIRFPSVESTALFQRSIGETTDIVEKEMYTFEDRNGESFEPATGRDGGLRARGDPTWVDSQPAAAPVVLGFVFPA